MSIVVTTYIPGAIVMSADTMMSVTQKNGEKTQTFSQTPYNKKIYLFNSFPFGIATVGAAQFQGKLIDFYFKKIDILLEKRKKENQKNDITVDEFKSILFETFKGLENAEFILSFFADDNPFVYHFIFKGSNMETYRLNFDDKSKEIQYGVTWKGYINPITYLLKTHPQEIQYNFFTVKDAIDFSEFLVRTTIDYVRFANIPKIVGGYIDTILLTPFSAKWISKNHESF